MNNNTTQYIGDPRYNNNKYDEYATHWKHDNRIKVGAPWAFVTITFEDGTSKTQRHRVYLKCNDGEMMVTKGKRWFFTGPHADSRLSYVLCD